MMKINHKKNIHKTLKITRFNNSLYPRAMTKNVNVYQIFFNCNDYIYIYIYVGTNCIHYSNYAGRGQAQYLISYV